MEEALHNRPMLHKRATLGNWTSRLPDEITVLWFRQPLEKHKLASQILVVINDLLRARSQMLRAGTAIDAALIAAFGSTRNASGKRDPEMHQSKKGNQR